ncbi:MAG: TAXI family TRAP transporter solute-binding subunit [Desulfuromonadaceae bacterium]|nr:TAXI family TRAP transporter solute-binding subunit [Desulfuromonadaceae bacterium]
MSSRKFVAVLLAGLFATSILFNGGVAEAAKTRLAFSGGPDGGTFQYFANAISSRLSRMEKDIDISNMASAGSVENLRRVNSGDADFGIVYSGDLYLARIGQLTNDTRKYPNVLAMSYLYGAPAHLLVLSSSGINSVQDLTGKRVAVGPAGSGAAASAQRYFTGVGLWDSISTEFIGYSQGASALGDKLVDAVWVFAGYPNASVIQAASSNSIKLLSLVEAGEATDFFTENPYYTKVVIPAGTYKGVDYDVHTIQDSAIWAAGKHMKDKHVFNALRDIYSDEGLGFMVSANRAASAMSTKDGLFGVATPVHPGAQKFWTEKGLTLTPDQK